MSVPFWFVSPALGVLAILGSRLFADLDITRIDSYAGTLSSFYFIAISLAVAAVLEAIELIALLAKQDKLKGNTAGGVGLLVALSVIFAACSVGAYYGALKDELAENPPIAWANIWFVVGFFAFAIIPGVAVRMQLEKARS